MTLREQISTCREALQAGHLVNEASVSTGIVFPLLNALDWPVFNPRVVAPEYALRGRRVDFALCDPPMRPAVIIEVKQPGRGERSDQQLFEYAFHAGVPMAVLTDGQEWHFYLPAEQGDYLDRRVYRLDLVERSLDECERRFRRYLSYSAVCGGQAFTDARADYQNVRRRRVAEAALPTAWKQIVDRQDELLLELIADQVENISGYRPDLEAVSQFVSERLTLEGSVSPRDIRVERVTAASSHVQVEGISDTGFVLNGDFFPGRSGREILVRFFQELDRRDPGFFERFSALPRHGTRRRYLSRRRSDLYPGRDDLAEQHSVEIRSGWWLGINVSLSQIERIIIMASEVAGLQFNNEVLLQLPRVGRS